jgi:hypothetical protein
MTTITSPSIGLSRDRWFFTTMALAMAFTVFAGFAPSFYLRSAAYQGPPLTPFVWAHALVLTIWILGNVVQTTLIASRNTALHRRFGWFFAAIAVVIVISGPELGIEAIRRGAVPPGLTPEQFLVLPMAAALMFAIFVGLGVWQRNNAQVHKRLMLLSTIAILDAAVARMPGMLAAGPLAFFAVVDLFIIAGMVYDYVSRGRVHPVWIYGGIAIVVSQAARLLLAGTGMWAAFVRFAVG